jgi:hypothetical protein
MPKEPLYPHVPKSREPQFPHVPRGQQPATKLPAPRYEFFPESVKGRLPPIGTTGEQKDPIVQVKFFTPWTNWTWYGIEFDGKDIFFGWVVGLEKEFGSFSLSELQSLKGPAGLKIERDIYFAPKPISQVMKEHGESLALPATIELLASTEGDPIRKFCCRQCGECAPKEFLEEGKFLDRISWLRSHYQTKHPGMWGKRLPLTMIKDFEPVSPQYRHLVGLVSDPLPKEAD